MLSQQDVIHLLAEDNLFDGPAYRCAWWEHLAPKFNVQPGLPNDFVIYPVRKWKGLLTIKELNLLGWNAYWPKVMDKSRIQAFEQLYEQGGWDCFRVLMMDWSQTHPFAQLLEARRISYQVVPAHQLYLCDLSEGWENYLSRVGKNTRRNFSRCIKQAEAHQVQVVVNETPEQIEQTFSEIIQSHQRYWNQRPEQSYFNDPSEQRFLPAWHQALVPPAEPLLMRVYYEDTLTNLNYYVGQKPVYYGYLTINTGAFTELSPGTAGLYYSMQQAIERGYALFNMGPFYYPYKARVSTHVVPLQEIIIAHPRSRVGSYHAKQITQALAKLNTTEKDTRR